MNLVESHQYSYDDIGIVVRNFEPYQSSLRRTFEEHRIPFSSSATIPIIQEPLIKHLIQLSSLPLTDFFLERCLRYFDLSILSPGSIRGDTRRNTA